MSNAFTPASNRSCHLSVARVAGTEIGKFARTLAVTPIKQLANRWNRWDPAEVVITAVDTFPSPSPSSLFLLSFPHLSRLIAALQTIRGPCCKSPNNCLPPVRFVTFRCPDCPLLFKDVPRKSSQGYRLGMYGHCACELITHLYVCFWKWRVSLNVNSSEGTFAQCK